MRCLVTGAAGFVGSHLVEAALDQGWDVVAVDSLNAYYEPVQKQSNAAAYGGRLPLRVVDLLQANLSPLLEGVDVVFHQAGQPGVRSSWDEFDSYVDANVRLTHRLLRAARSAEIKRFVFASSSSVYGDRTRYPTTEQDLPAPKSPYGVTKLAAEHLCGVYARNWGMQTVSLRYFTVFGPRQRPDMAMHRLIEAALTGLPFPLYGAGDQIRDFTYVADVVAANVKAATAAIEPGTVLNIAGGGSTTLAEVISTVEELTGSRIELERYPDQPGDVFRTGGSADLARAILEWAPKVSVAEGLAAQVEWHRSRRS
ncbi:MAG: NAD-dependent epimerase/dehydratase family protein [Acidimicrobiia bacterium]